MNEQHDTSVDRKTVAQTLVAGIVAAFLCLFTSYSGFVSRLALVLAPSLLVLGVVGLVDIRIFRAAIRKPGESMAHLPLWVRAAGYACWCPTIAVLAYVVIRKLTSE